MGKKENKEEVNERGKEKNGKTSLLFPEMLFTWAITMWILTAGKIKLQSNSGEIRNKKQECLNLLMYFWMQGNIAHFLKYGRFTRLLIRLVESVPCISIGKNKSQTKTVSFHSATPLGIREFISMAYEQNLWVIFSAITEKLRLKWLDFLW